MVSFVSPRDDYLQLHDLGLTLDIWLLAATNLTLAACLVVLTGVPTYFFHPRRLPVELQNRGLALAYYTCAPFAWTPVIYLAGWLATIPIFPHLAGPYLALALTSVQILSWWCALACLARRVLREQAHATLLAYVAPPLAALLGSAVTFYMIFQIARYFGLLCFSLLP